MEVVSPQPSQKTVLPNSSATLVLGIISVVPMCLGLGLILGIIGLVISKEAKLLYEKNPDAYTGYSNLNAGRVLCIIGIVLGGISFMVLLAWILGITALIGTLAGFGSM